MKYLALLILCLCASLIGAVPGSRFKRGDEQNPTVRPAVQACQSYESLKAILPVERIFGGNTPTEWPWMAALGYQREQQTLSFDCAGTIISEKYILTAAHCSPKSRAPVLVRVGSNSTNEYVNIQRFIKHAEFSTTWKYNDIALIELAKPIQFTQKIQPACLHTDFDVDSREKVFVTGWGTIPNAGIQRSNELKVMNVQPVSLSECNATYLEYNRLANVAALRNGISESQYCAKDASNGPCQGDAGAPLQFIPTVDAPAKVVAIVSFGVSCGTTLPTVYTRVSHYLDWIESVVWPNGVTTTQN